MYQKWVIVDLNHATSSFYFEGHLTTFLSPKSFTEYIYASYGAVIELMRTYSRVSLEGKSLHAYLEVDSLKYDMEQKT